MQMPTISLYTICMFYEDAKHQSVLKYILKLHTKSEFTQVKLHSQKKKNKKKTETKEKKLSLGVLCNKLYKLNYFNYEIPKSIKDSKRK